MKKTDKKLRLSRETLRSLDRAGLSQAEGGTHQATIPDTVFDTICDYTYSCSCPELCVD